MSIVGIDIGGTSFRVVLLDRSGRILERAIEATAPERGARETIARIIACIHRLQAKAGVALEALGVGITGPVDPLTGIVTNPFTLGGWPATDLREPFRMSLGIPVAVDNDANVAAVGEAWLGAGRGFTRIAMVTVGTGIGVASVLEGKVQRAIDGRHGEAGHMVLNPAGPACYCGANGCWESLASGTAIGTTARDLAHRREGQLWELAGGDLNRIDARLLFEAAAGGDAPAKAVVNATARWIGLGLVNLASTLMPDVFILAGGVVRHLDVMKPAIDEIMRRHAVMVPTDTPILAAALGDEAGPIGAAKLAIGQAL